MRAPKSTEDVFTGMAALLAEPSSWTKGFGARDANGLPTPPTSATAVCWCLYGAREVALSRVADPELRAQLDDETDEILHELCNGTSPSAVNDDRTTTHADILALLRQASSSPSRNA